MVQSDDKTIPFLRRLSDLLQENKDIISFQPGIINDGHFAAGKIIVHDRARVEAEVLPKYFNHSSFASLRRQLNYFAFVRVGKSRQRGAIYSNESVVNLKDILRLKRRVVGGAYTTSESSETQSEKFENDSIVYKSVNLKASPKFSITEPNTFRKSDASDAVLPENITLSLSTSHLSKDKQDINFNKRSFSTQQEDKKYDVASTVHLPLRKKIKFSYESSIGTKTNFQHACSKLLPYTVKKISDNICELNNADPHCSQGGIDTDSSLYTNSDRTFFFQHSPGFHQFEISSSHQKLSSSFKSQNLMIPNIQEEASPNFETRFKQPFAKDDDILAGCNALLALNRNSRRVPHIQSAAYLFT